MISPSCSLETLGFSMAISDAKDAQSYTISGHL
jgi:hypothetical protein